MLLIDRPDLAEDEAIAYAGTDSADTADVRAAVDAWTRQQTTDDIVELASAFRIPVSPIGHGANLVENEQLVARGFYDVSSNAVTTKPCFRFTPHQRARVDRRSPDRLHENAAEINPTMSLTGIRVVDMTAWWAGPAATHLYAALGADVVKIESARRPDGMRYSFVPDPAAQDWWEHGPVYYALNTNKRGMSLDFTHPQGRELLTDLITNADLLIENFTPRVLDSLDLDWDLIHELNPGLVTVRMPAFGLEGPWRDRTGFAQTIEQSSGLAWTTGHANGSPVAPRGVCDPLAGIHAAFAGLAALERRDREDQGGMMEVPMLDVAATATLGQVLAWRSTGAAPQRVGNRSPRLAPQGTYRAAGVDDWVTLSVRDDDDWIALADLLEQPQWRHAPWLDPTYRAQNGGEIDAGIANWMGSRPGSVGAEALRSVGIPAARADGSGRLLQHPQLQHRDFFETVDHPVAGRHPVPGLPFRPVDRRVLWNRCAAPILGQHTAEVLRDWLGLDDTAINDIMAAGITGTDPTATEER
jgi:crotonobetainyl-CoA:carnitine CoA-transferase CaiB-like acyl-CoA transferase